MAGSASPKESARSTRSNTANSSHERTPLLSRNVDEDERVYTEPGARSPAERSLRSIQEDFDANKKSHIRWPTVVALSTLCVVILAILGIGFAAPAVVEEYAKQAVLFEPTKLSIDSFTSTGVNARVQGTVTLDASRVEKKPIRDIGKIGTWIARAIETGESELQVFLPAYDNVLLGTAKVPPIKVNIRNGHVNAVDFVTQLQPGHIEGIRRVANDWLDGRRPSGGHDVPTMPGFDISKLNFYEVDQPVGQRSMVGQAVVTVENQYPVRLDVPELGFDVFIPNCSPEQDYLHIAKAATDKLDIRPKKAVNVSVSAIMKPLPGAVTAVCPGSTSSPLDVLLGSYIQGDDTTVYIRGSESPSLDTPRWITDLTKSITVPLPFPGRSLDGLIRNFTLADVHFSLPNPLAEPGDPDSHPRVSAVVKALVGLPKEMNFPLDVSQVRANADVFYHGKKLGELDLSKWQAANTSRVEDKQNGPGLLVQSVVDQAPLNITDDDVFTDVVQSLVFGKKKVSLTVKAKVDVETQTALGDFVVRDIPASGNVFVKPIGGSSGVPGFRPSIGDLKILETTKHSLRIQAKVNLTNPTEYSATVPYVNIHILNNDTVLGHATAKDIVVAPGNNTDMLVEAVWEPMKAGGEKGSEVGRTLLSQYVSGFNTTLTLKTHEESIPSQPALGRALSAFSIMLDTPKLRGPAPPDGEDGDHDDEQDGPRFIKDATMHLISSSATFTLLSPFSQTSLFITNISAVAFYNHTDPVGTIEYDLPFEVPPGASTSPRLPVDWSLGGAGYDAVRDALGGSLKLDARADAGVRIDKWEEQIWFVGSGIGASIRL